MMKITPTHQTSNSQWMTCIKWLVQGVQCYHLSTKHMYVNKHQNIDGSPVLNCTVLQF